MHDTLLSIACRHSLVSSVVHFGFAKECDKEDEGDKKTFSAPAKIDLGDVTDFYRGVLDLLLQ